MRIKNLNPEDLTTMIEAVAVRYRVKCDEMNNLLIRQTLQDGYNNMLVNDFNQAFISHCLGKFMISKESEGNKPYGDLSCLFVCDVIKHFKIWKAKEIAKPKLIDVSKQIPMPEETDKQHHEFIEAVLLAENKLPMFADWSRAYLHLEKIGEIEYTLDEKIMFAENVKFDMQEEMGRLRVLKENYGHLDKILKDNTLFKKEVRKRAVIQYYDNLKNNAK